MDPPPPPPPAAPPGGPPPGWSPAAAPAWPPARRSSRRWWWLAVPALAVLVFLALFVVGTRTTPTPAGSAGTAFTDPQNHFSATYEHKPVEQDQSTPVGGRTISEVLWTDAIDSNTAEIVGYANYPASFSVADPHNALDASVNGEVTNSHGSLVSKSFGSYQGFQSVDALVSAAGGYVQTRAVLAGRTLFIVVVTSLHNPPELFAGFANSLHVLNHAS